MHIHRVSIERLHGKEKKILANIVLLDCRRTVTTKQLILVAVASQTHSSHPWGIRSCHSSMKLNQKNVFRSRASSPSIPMQPTSVRADCAWEVFGSSLPLNALAYTRIKIMYWKRKRPEHKRAYFQEVPAHQHEGQRRLFPDADQPLLHAATHCKYL